MEDGAAAHTKINERARQVPDDFFHIIEAHPTPPLMIKKKKASVVTTVFTTADAIRILWDMPTKFMDKPRCKV